MSSFSNFSEDEIAGFDHLSLDQQGAAAAGDEPENSNVISDDESNNSDTDISDGSGGGATPIASGSTETMLPEPICFYDWRNTFPCLKVLLDNVKTIKAEMEQVPRWVPWPEDHIGSNPKSEWSVFPFLHTFPATDTSKMTWIGSTNQLCPRTSKLLKGIPNIRTALLSKLGPETSLGFHTGWEDLANHVLRCHIPIYIPKSGASGLVVRSETMLYEEGKIIIFDDSLRHKAFNSCSDETRIVLIVDIMRPSHIPNGTVKGGHTKELDDLLARFK